MTVPTKIRAVREDPENPQLSCYEGNPEGLSELLAKRTPKEPTLNPMNGIKMSHNFTGYIPEGTHKRRVSGLSSSNPVTMLKSLEALGLLASTDALQKLVSSGDMKLSAVGEKRKFAPYEVDEAFTRVDVSVSDRIAFKINLERAGLMKPNPI